MDFFKGLDRYFEINYLIKSLEGEILGINNTSSNYYRFYNFIKDNNFEKPYELEFNESDSLALLTFLLKICKDTSIELNIFEQFKELYNFAKKNIVFYGNNDNIKIFYECEQYQSANNKQILDYEKLTFGECFDKIKKMLVENIIKGKTLKEKIDNLYNLSAEHNDRNVRYTVKLMLLHLSIENSLEFNEYINDLVQSFDKNTNSRSILKFLNENEFRKEVCFINTDSNNIENTSIGDISFENGEIITKNNRIKEEDFDLTVKYLFNSEDKKNIDVLLKHYLKNPNLEDEAQAYHINDFLKQNSKRQANIGDTNEINEYYKLNIVASCLNRICINTQKKIDDKYISENIDDLALNDQKVKQVKEEQKNIKSSKNMLLFASISAGVLLGIVITTMIIIRKKHKKQK